MIPFVLRYLVNELAAMNVKIDFRIWNFVNNKYIKTHKELICYHSNILIILILILIYKNFLHL